MRNSQEGASRRWRCSGGKSCTFCRSGDRPRVPTPPLRATSPAPSSSASPGPAPSPPSSPSPPPLSSSSAERPGGGTSPCSGPLRQPQCPRATAQRGEAPPRPGIEAARTAPAPRAPPTRLGAHHGEGDAPGTLPRDPPPRPWPSSVLLRNGACTRPGPLRRSCAHAEAWRGVVAPSDGGPYPHRRERSRTPWRDC